MTAIDKCHQAQTKAVHYPPSNFQEHFMNKQHLITIALGTAFAAVTLLPAHAAGNPFAAKTLDAGYQVAQADMKMDSKAKDGKCGEGKCGADKKMGTKAKDGKCGEAKCGADKKMDSKAKDGKCGEAKCGADKKK